MGMTTEKLHRKLIDNPLGAAIRNGRAAKGWSQDDLASHSDVSKRLISKMENGNMAKRPRPEPIILVARTLGEDPQDFLALAGLESERIPNRSLVQIPPPSGSEGRELSTGELKRVGNEEILSPRAVVEIADRTAREAGFSVGLQAEFLDWVRLFGKLSARGLNIEPKMFHLLGFLADNRAVERPHIPDTAYADIMATIQHIIAISSRLRTEHSRINKARDIISGLTLGVQVQRLEMVRGPYPATDDARIFEELWAGIIAEVNSSVWATNLARCEATGGRSYMKRFLGTQQAAINGEREIELTRLFVLHPEECDINQELPALVKVLLEQWAIGVRIGLVSKPRFDSLTSTRPATFRSLDFMLLDDEKLHFTHLDEDGQRIVLREFSENQDHLRSARFFIREFERSVKFYHKDTASARPPDFADAIRSLKM